jgi:hypothetical protein
LIFIQSQNERVLGAFKIAGYDVSPFSQFTPGQHAIIVMPDIPSLEDAASKGVPVIIIAGTRNPAGVKRMQAALTCGIPDQCVLFLENGSVVDGTGEVIGPALRGNGISAHSAVKVAERAVKEQWIPEVPIWVEESEPAIYEMPTDLPEATIYAAEAEVPKPPKKVEVPKKLLPLKQWLEQQMSLADKVVMVFGIRPGVGVSTVSAGLAGIFQDRDSLYAEISDSPIGYTFFGKTLSEAVKNGRYTYCGSNSETEPKKCGVLVVEVGIKDAAANLYDQADCVVVVTDGTPPAFERTGNWIKGGWRTDVLVVNKVVSGAGFPPEVYTGEYGVSNILGIPGGPEEEAAIHTAQTEGRLPCGYSVDLDTAFTRLAEAVLNSRGAVLC